MGEIIFSICVGGFLSLSGVALIVVLRREEKKLNREKNQSPKAPNKAPPVCDGEEGAGS